MKPWLIALALAALTAAAGIGYRRGATDCRAAYQARELAHIERANQLDRARIANERTRATLARTLEEKAHADPVSVPRCLGADRVRRLNSLR
ncbi:hypothetical protein [Phaeobacter sp. B1627]|uniref:hypothetical protein n=1 Tax=Phaeobacter sp. B1627 TaxID=2583809 RepID=UPI001117D6C8|nr:hypothetical protein [Phaeobacter sp. B1627]TNJ39063.1 hypothetical protein FGE21_19240 [Phaeobacter sp. B1627]